MEDTVIPYELPEPENHSFFFIDQRIEPSMEAKLHRHDAWELYCVLKGYGNRMAGDSLRPFAEGSVALIPPGMLHRWEYAPGSVDEDGKVRYLMVAFHHSLVEQCMSVFPELRNRLRGVVFTEEAMEFGMTASCTLRGMLAEMIEMDELGRLSVMLRLLPFVYTSNDRIFAGKPLRIERDVRRIQRVAEYVMAHYGRDIRLGDVASEIGMNRSAFCTYFKKHKGMTFSQFLTRYRLKTACELLKHSQKSVSEVCYLVGFNDLPHFVRVFGKEIGVSPSKYRRDARCNF